MHGKEEFDKLARMYVRSGRWLNPRLPNDLRYYVHETLHKETLAELDVRFGLFKKELASMGYEKLYVAKHPFSSALQGPSHIVAWPKQLDGWRPALWSSRVFDHGCANGMEKADQMQLHFDMPVKYHGEHVLP
jgi:hypothetical protein